MELNSDLTNSLMVQKVKEYGPSSKEKKDQISFLQTIIDFYLRLGCWIITSISIFCPFLFLYMCAKPSLWILAAAYLMWMYYDRETPHRGDRRLKWIRKLKLWQFRRDYFPIKLIKTAELPPNTTYLFSCFPHGVYTYGASTNFLCEVNQFSDAFPGLDPYFNIASFIFGVPFWRDLALFYGACSVSSESISRILNGSPGNVSIVQVGGVLEMTKSSPGTNRLVLKNRKGFVKLALKAGSSLVPVYTFGETDVYDQPSGEWYEWLQENFRYIFRRWIGGLIIPIGPRRASYLFGIFPYQRPITTVVGRPIKLPKVENPSGELVNKFHEIFTQELILLFEKYKVKYDSRGEKATLIIE